MAHQSKGMLVLEVDIDTERHNQRVCSSRYDSEDARKFTTRLGRHD